MAKPHLLDFEFFQRLGDALERVTDEDLKEICPGPPIPPDAVLAGQMPHHLKQFLALITMVDARLSQEQEALEASVQNKQVEAPPLPEVRSLKENSTMLEMLFWHMLRAEVPPPPYFDDDMDPLCGYGPNLEVYYRTAGQMGETVNPSPESFEISSPEIGYVQ